MRCANVIEAEGVHEAEANTDTCVVSTCAAPCLTSRDKSLGKQYAVQQTARETGKQRWMCSPLTGPLGGVRATSSSALRADLMGWPWALRTGVVDGADILSRRVARVRLRLKLRRAAGRVRLVSCHTPKERLSTFWPNTWRRSIPCVST